MGEYTQAEYAKAVSEYRIKNPVPYQTFIANSRLFRKLHAEGLKMDRGIDLWNQHRILTEREIRTLVGAPMEEIPVYLKEPLGYVPEQEKRKIDMMQPDDTGANIIGGGLTLTLALVLAALYLIFRKR